MSRRCCIPLHADCKQKTPPVTRCVIGTPAKTRSLAVTARLHDASCHCIFCQVTQGHSKCHPWLLHVKVPISIPCYMYDVICNTNNCSSIFCRFWDIQHQIIAWPWILGYGSFKVTESGTIRKLGVCFLFTFHSNYGSVFSCFNTIHECDRQPATVCFFVCLIGV